MVTLERKKAPSMSEEEGSENGMTSHSLDWFILRERKIMRQVVINMVAETAMP